MTDYKGIIYLFLFVGGMYLLRAFTDSLSDGKKNLYMPYHVKHILTSSEYKFYNSLKPILDANSYLICPKVELKDLFEVNGGTKDRQRYFSRISQKHVDFLVCDGKLKSLFAIELDDKSHRRAAVKERDDFKDILFKKTGLPLYRVPTNGVYNEEYLKRYIPMLETSEKN